MKKINIKLKKGFSLIELIFVIIVLGIISSIGSEIIVQTYSGYLMERSVHRGTIKTEIAANHIANRLSKSIPNTVIARRGPAGDYMAIEEIPVGTTDHTILQWIGYDDDSFSAVVPGWTGVADLTASAENILVSPGSSTAMANFVIFSLTGNKTMRNGAIFFPGEYTAYNVGYDSGDNSGADTI